MGGVVLDGPCAGSWTWDTLVPIPDVLVGAIAPDGVTTLFDSPEDQLELGEQAHEYRRSEKGPSFLCGRSEMSGCWLYYEHVGPIRPERVAAVLRHYSNVYSLPGQEVARA